MSSIYKTDEDTLRFLIYKEDGVVFAHCLEMDLLADGKNIREAIERLLGVIEHHINCLIEDDALEQFYNPAPLEYWRMFSTLSPDCH